MSRDASGNYTLPAGNPVATGTTITVAWANPTMADVGAELTNSLDRGGRGPMTAPLKLAAGSAAAPALTFNLGTSSGLYRAAALDLRFSVGGVDTFRWIDDTGTAAGAQQPAEVWDGAAWRGVVYTGGPNALPVGTVDDATIRWDATSSRYVEATFFKIIDTGLSLTVVDGEIIADDTDGSLTVGAGDQGVAYGGNVKFYGDTHATQAGDFEIRSGTTVVFRYDASADSNLFIQAADFSTASNIASAATIDLDAMEGNRAHVTGTTQIDAVTLTNGPRTLIFDGVLTLAYHATNNKLPTGGDIVTAAGDIAVYESDGTTVYCAVYTRADGSALTAGGGLSRTGRTSNSILVSGDEGQLIDITSGTFTQTFTDAATLGSSWFVYLRNSGTGAITLDPNGSETIDGLTSFIMYPNECRLITCDGSNFFSVVLTPFAMTIDTSTTFTKPSGYGSFVGRLWGGGASGGKGAASCSGGGGGACVPFDIPASDFSATETVTIAAGGAGPTAAAAAGVAGGTSSIGTLVYAYGGGAGYYYSSGTTTPAGGGGGSSQEAGENATNNASVNGGGPNPVSKDAVANGNTGLSGAPSRPNGGYGYDSEYGGAGGGGFENAPSGRCGGDSTFGGGGGGGRYTGSGSDTTGGTSKYGGDGGGGRSTTSGQDGATPAGGGGGTLTGTKAGDGGDGLLYIRGM